jgi:hypothetical protein
MFRIATHPIAIFIARAAGGPTARSGEFMCGVTMPRACQAISTLGWNRGGTRCLVLASQANA